MWSQVPLAPEDPILGVNLSFKADPAPDKLNLGVGAYRTEEGKPLVLGVVKKVELEFAQSKDLNKEYLPIDGLEQFNQLSAQLLFGADSPALKEQRVATVQSLSGTGALRLGAAFLKVFLPAGSAVYVSDPTWGNHNTIFAHSGFASSEIRKYRYFDKNTNGLDFKGMLDDIENAPPKSIILLHTCAHNPTGVDPTPDQWKSIIALLKERNHVGFFDTAYQGFATGNLDLDAAPVRLAVKEGLDGIIASQSYAKNFGLYGERVGALNLVCRDEKEAQAVRSQLKVIIRPMYSNPPGQGARIVARVLSDKQLYQEWLGDLKDMSGRIKRMRDELYDALVAKGTPGEWGHIRSQIGMFSYTGLTEPQVEVMIKKHHVHMLKNGRISMAGLSSATVPKLSGAIDDVVRNVKSKSQL